MDQVKAREYFSTINPLAARISEYIKEIEPQLEVIENEIKDKDLAYNMRCAAIDKHLIGDVVVQTANGQKLTKSSSGLNYPNPPKDYLSELIMFVCPPRREKLVNDKKGVLWLDEYSSPNFCKISHCTLGQTLIKKDEEATRRELNIQNGIQNGVVISQNRKGTTVKQNAPKCPKSHSQSAQADVYQQKLIVPDQKSSVAEETRLAKRIGGHSIFGIGVMGFPGNPNSMRLPSKEKSGCGHPNYDDDIENSEGEDDIIPKQKQNLELIAELQAKLKKASPAVNQKDSVDGLEQCSAEAKPSLGKPKVRKPKAPPPPPPVQQKRVDSLQLQHQTPTTTITPPTSQKQHQFTIKKLKSVFHVKKQNQKCQQEVHCATGHLSNQEGLVSPTSSHSVKVAYKQESNQQDNNLAEFDKIEKLIANENSSDFLVDVSSPCRIATPKTGLDILDNW